MGKPGLSTAFPTAVSKEQELEVLKQQALGLERTLGELRSRIQELDRPTPDISEKERE